MPLPTVRIATCHLSPVLLSAHLTTQKAITHIHAAARHSAQFIAFPESFIPGFPIWSALLAPSQTHQYFASLAQQSLLVDGDEVSAIRAAAHQTRTTVSLGFSERVRYSSATLFNSNLIIGPDGGIRVHHRKLAPTFFEKLSWAAGDGHGLRVAELDSGVKVGALICGENTNPLARYALMAQGEQIHVSTWPAAWPTRPPHASSPSSAGEAKDTNAESSRTMPPRRNYDNVSANRVRAAAHCFEAKCFGILCAAHLSQQNIDAVASIAESSASQSLVQDALQKASRAPSMVLDPTGAPVMGFTIDNAGRAVETDMLQHEEGILYANLDLNECVEGKQYHDVVGGYQRFDVFSLQVNRTRRGPAVFVDDVKNDGITSEKDKTKWRVDKNVGEENGRST